MSNEQEIRTLAGILCKAIQDNGIAEFNLDYTGSSDSTDGFTATVLPEEKQELAATLMVTYDAVERNWSGGTWTDRIVTKAESLEEATYSLAELMWDHAGQGGWYNNDGGGGNVTLFPGGTYEFRHYNYVSTEEEAAHWRANIFAGPVDAPYEETAET